MFVVAGPVAGASWRELHVSWLIRSRLSVIQRAAGQNRIMMKLAACQICQRVHSWRSFHCGCAPSIFRVAIVASLSMLAYESVLGIFRSGYIRTWRPALNWTSFSGWARSLLYIEFDVRHNPSHAIWQSQRGRRSRERVR